jgi:hypothetical protein
MRMLYKYPQAAFPYGALVEENRRRGREAPEFELVDTGVFDGNRYFDVFVEYAKADVEDLVMRVTVTNHGPEPAPIHVLPHLWYRNTWSWTPGSSRPVIHSGKPGSASTEHLTLGTRWWYVRAQDGTSSEFLFTDNETNAARLFGVASTGAPVKDGINDAVVDGRRDRISTERGSKVAAHLRAMVGPGESFTVQIRLTPEAKARPFAHFDRVMARRLAEADEFYAAIQGSQLTEDERLVQRQAYAGLLWSKQFYHYDVHHWLAGDLAQPQPPRERWQGRNRDWALHFHSADSLMMPCKGE